MSRADNDIRFIFMLMCCFFASSPLCSKETHAVLIVYMFLKSATRRLYQKINRTSYYSSSEVCLLRITIRIGLPHSRSLSLSRAVYLFPFIHLYSSFIYYVIVTQDQPIISIYSYFRCNEYFRSYMKFHRDDSQCVRNMNTNFFDCYMRL